MVNQKYVSVKIPGGLADKIDLFRRRNPQFRSRAEVVVTAIRYYLPVKEATA